MDENILFICRSMNQTTMMHQIAQHMGEYNYYFTPYYADGSIDLAARAGWLDFTVLGRENICAIPATILPAIICPWIPAARSINVIWY